MIDLFNFLSPFLRNAELAKPVTILYRGCLRVLLVLLHDFPEFLCDYHYNFCDVIPPNCIQVRRNVQWYRWLISSNCIQVRRNVQWYRWLISSNCIQVGCNVQWYRWLISSKLHTGG